MNILSKYGRLGYIMLFSTLFFGACEKSDTLGDEDALGETANSKVNRWVHNTMKQQYLWLDEIKDFGDYRSNAEPMTFFSLLISDNEKRKDTNGNEYYYSYIIDNNTTKTSHTNKDTYGIEFVAYKITNENRYELRVMYTLPGSAAEKSGIKRGHWIALNNGEKITTIDDIEQFLSGDAKLVTVIDYGELTIDESTGNYSPKIYDIQLAKSEITYDNPIVKNTIFNEESCNVGYLAYTHFTTGPDSYENVEYNNQLTKIFSNFKNENVTKLIIDLRYNGGGYLSCAQHLASLMSREEHKENIFCKVIRNSQSPYSNNVFKINENNLGYLDLNDIYFIISEYTASASEALINGLKPFSNLNVYTVGTRSEGKNLASNNFVNEGLKWEIQPITGKVCNMNDDGNYGSGFAPDYKIDEFDGENYGWYWGEFGTKEDKIIEFIIDEKINGATTKSINNQTEKQSVYINKKETRSISSLERKK